jgi:hypothetical protein
VFLDIYSSNLTLPVVNSLGLGGLSRSGRSGVENETREERRKEVPNELDRFFAEIPGVLQTGRTGTRGRGDILDMLSDVGVESAVKTPLQSIGKTPAFRDAR